MASGIEQVPGQRKFRLARGNASVLIGGEREQSGLFIPEFTLRKFIAQIPLTLTHAPSVAAQRRVSGRREPILTADHLNGKSVELIAGTLKHRFTQGTLEASLDWSIVYTDKGDIPDEREEFLITEGLDDLAWFEQQQLTAQEIAEGAYRPDDIINSFAVYAEQWGNVKDSTGELIADWGCGKFCHVKRSKMTAGDDAWTWCYQYIDGDDLCVDMPWDFINAHSGPWSLDPEIGYTTAGGTSFQWGADYLGAFGYGTAASPAGYSPASDGDVDSVSLYMDPIANAGVTLGLYTESAGAPDAEHCVTDDCDTTTSSAEDWYTADYAGGTQAISSANEYFLAASLQEQTYLFYDTTGSGCYYYESGVGWVSGQIPDAGPSTKSGNTRQWSIYVTYTESAEESSSSSSLGVSSSSSSLGVSSSSSSSLGLSSSSSSLGLSSSSSSLGISSSSSSSLGLSSSSSSEAYSESSLSASSSSSTSQDYTDYSSEGYSESSSSLGLSSSSSSEGYSESSLSSLSSPSSSLGLSSSSSSLGLSSSSSSLGVSSSSSSLGVSSSSSSSLGLSSSSSSLGISSSSSSSLGVSSSSSSLGISSSSSSLGLSSSSSSAGYSGTSESSPSSESSSVGLSSSSSSLGVSSSSSSLGLSSSSSSSLGVSSSSSSSLGLSSSSSSGGYSSSSSSLGLSSSSSSLGISSSSSSSLGVSSSSSSLGVSSSSSSLGHSSSSSSSLGISSSSSSQTGSTSSASSLAYSSSSQSSEYIGGFGLLGTITSYAVHLGRITSAPIFEGTVSQAL